MPKHHSPWWGNPANFSERKNERKVSWLELFFDLGYVAVISQLTHYAVNHPSLYSVGMFALLFSLVLWSWVNGSQYYDLHGDDNLRTRVYTFWQILAVAAIAVTLKDIFNGDHKGFVVIFSIMQIIITYLWWSVGLHDRSHRALNKFYTINYLVALGLLITSFFLEFRVAVWLLCGVLLLDLTPSLTGAKTIVRVLKERGQVFSASATIVERFGLFAIIVLAESVLGAVTGIAHWGYKHPIAWLAFGLAVGIAFLLWCIYFDMTSEQETKPGYANLQWLIFLHFPLLGGTGLIGGCIRELVLDAPNHPSHRLKWVFCISLAVVLCTISALTRIMKEREEDRSYIGPVSVLLVVCGVVLLTVPVMAPWSAVGLLGVCGGILLIPVITAIVSWVRYRFR